MVATSGGGSWTSTWGKSRGRGIVYFRKTVKNFRLSSHCWKNKRRKEKDTPFNRWEDTLSTNWKSQAILHILMCCLSNNAKSSNEILRKTKNKILMPMTCLPNLWTGNNLGNLSMLGSLFADTLPPSVQTSQLLVAHPYHPILWCDFSILWLCHK